MKQKKSVYLQDKNCYTNFHHRHLVKIIVKQRLLYLLLHRKRKALGRNEDR